MATRQARIELSADDRKLNKKLRESRKRWETFGRSISKGAMEIRKSTGAMLGKIGGSTFAKLSALTGFAGVTAMFGSEAQKTMEFEEQLARLGIAARGSLGSMDQFRDRVFAVSNATGLAREDVLRGANAFVTLTGDAATAGKSLELFAKIQRGTGADMQDIASTAAALKQNMKILPEDFEKAFSVLIKGGKDGSVELRDMGQLLAQLAPQMAEFAGGTGVTGMADLASGLQLVNQGFNDADQAATALEGLMSAIIKNSGRLKAAGVDVFTTDSQGNKHLKNLQEIVAAIGNSKLAKDPTLLVKALGRKEAYQAYLQLTKVEGAWDAAAAATLDANDVSEDYAKFQESTAGRLQAAWNEIKNQVAEVFTAERIRAFVDGMGAVLQMAKDFAGTMKGFIEWVAAQSGEESAGVNNERVAAAEAAMKKSGLSRSDLAGMEAATDDAATEKLIKAGVLPGGIGNLIERQQKKKDIAAGAQILIGQQKNAVKTRKTNARIAAQNFRNEMRIAEQGGVGPLTSDVLDEPAAGPTWGHRWRNNDAMPGALIRVEAGPGLDVVIANDPKQMVQPP